MQKNNDNISAYLIPVDPENNADEKIQVSQEFTIGKSIVNDLCIDNSSISFKHARIKRTHQGYEIEDLGSDNGTLINNTKVETSVLQDGDLLSFDKISYRFETNYKDLAQTGPDQKTLQQIPESEPLDPALALTDNKGADSVSEDLSKEEEDPVSEAAQDENPPDPPPVPMPSSNEKDTDSTLEKFSKEEKESVVEWGQEQTDEYGVSKKKSKVETVISQDKDQISIEQVSVSFNSGVEILDESIDEIIEINQVPEKIAGSEQGKEQSSDSKLNKQEVVTGLIWFYFSTQGRIKRIYFFVGVLGLDFAISLIGTPLSLFIPDSSFRIQIVAPLLKLYPSFCLYAKRLHDINMKGWPGWIIAVFFALYTMLSYFNIRNYGDFSTLLVFIPSLLLLLLIFKKGTDGPNQFGKEQSGWDNK